MKVLITGDKGFVGSETTRLLANKLVPGTNERIEVIGYDLMRGQDIRDKDLFRRYVKHYRPDRILHLAAIARFADADKDPKLAFETNVLGTQNVAEVAKEFHIALVYSSTGSVYMPINGEPPITESFQARGNSVYGCTKYMGELCVKEHTPHIILRYAHLYGTEKRNEGLIGNFITRIERGVAPQLYGGKQSSDFTYIKDVAEANYLAITASWDKWNEVYNIGTGEEISAEKAGELICKLTGWTGGMSQTSRREVDPNRFVFDITKAREKLGFNPQYTFEQGLKEMFNG